MTWLVPGAARSCAARRSLGLLEAPGQRLCPGHALTRLNPQPANCLSTCSARGTGATAPYPVVDNAAHTLA